MAVDNARRWSEVVPPQTALSFAAIWDPDDGLVTFSGPELLNAPDTWSASTLRDLPLDANEGRSQILTLDGFSLPFSNAMMDTAGLPRANRVQFMADALDEGQSMLDPYMRYFEERRRAAGKKDDAKKTRWKRQGIVHLDWSQLRNASAAMASLGNRILRPFTIHSPDEQDEFTYDGLFEEVPVTARTSTSAPMLVHLHLKSAFSVTTTSTTGYVDIDTPSEYSQGDSEIWSTLREGHFESYPNRLPARRRLRKPRPLPGDSAPASPDEVLARSEYNHIACPAEGACRPTETPSKGLHRLKSLPKINVKPSRPSPLRSASIDTDKTLPPVPSLPPLPLSSPPSSPASRSGSGGERTLKKQMSMTKVVREGVEKLTKCHGKGISKKREDGQHVSA